MNSSTLAHSQVRERTARQPARSSLKVPVRGAGATAVTRIRERKPALARKVPASIASPQPAADGRNEHARDRGTADGGDVGADGDQRVCLLEIARSDGLRQQRLRGGHEERLCDPINRLQDDELPYVRLARQEQQRRPALRGGANQVGGDHDGPPGEPVRPHPSEQHEGHERDRLRRQHQPEVLHRAGEVQHRERQRNRDDPVAHGRDPLTEEEEPERTLAPGSPPHRGRLPGSPSILARRHVTFITSRAKRASSSACGILQPCLSCPRARTWSS